MHVYDFGPWVISFSFQNLNSWPLQKPKLSNAMAETMAHHHNDVWKMQEQMISLFNRYLLQTETDTGDQQKHYGSPKSTTKDKTVI